MADSVTNPCLQCGASFSTPCHLRRHVRKFHPDNANTLAPMKYKNPENFSFSCSLCDKNFSHKRNLSSHMKVHSSAVSASPVSDSNSIKNRRKSIKCPMCDHTDSIRKQLLEHMKRFHEIEISVEEMEFVSKNEFMEWKNEEECQTNSRFVVEKNKTLQDKKITIYACHRSGNYIPSGKNLRHLKTQGSYKIGAYCPAGIKMTELFNDGKVQISYTETHVGHQVEIGHLLLTKEDRRSIATQIAAEIPFNDILDGIQDTITNEELKRIHLTTKKDLYNIEQSLLTKVESSWEPPSQQSNEIYRIQKNLPACDCKLICNECKICIHRFCCSCPDSAIKFKICKHIHLVAQKSGEVLRTGDSTRNINAQPSEEHALFMHINDRDVDEKIAIVKQVSKQRELIEFKEDKEKTTQTFLNYMNNIQSPCELEIIKKAIAHISSLMAAVSQTSSARAFPEPQRKDAPNAKITVQTRLFPTKKAASKKK